MVKYLAILLLTALATDLYSQSRNDLAATKNYTSSQKRLLIVSTRDFIDLLSQGKLDDDSILHMACELNHLPLLTICPDDFNSDSSGGTDLINAGKMPEAIRFLNHLKGMKRVQLLYNLAAWYIYKTGRLQNDLTLAKQYIEDALSTNNLTGDTRWRYDLLRLQSEYYYQSGDVSKSKKILLQIISSSQKERNMKITADAWEQLARMPAETDSLNLVYLNNALALYLQLKLKEKEIEILYQLCGLHLRSDANLAGNELQRILYVQESTGYNHSLFAEYLLSFIKLKHADYLESLQHANLAIENMKRSGLSAMQGTFYMRLGAVYEALGKSDEALSNFKKALENRTEATHLFWFKSLLFSATLLTDLNRPGESLSLIHQITSQFPPVSQWEKAQILGTEGVCYEKLNNFKMADRSYRLFLDLINQHPDVDPIGEFDETYLDIASYYLTRLDFKMSRLFVAKVTAANTLSMGSNAIRNFILFKLDSAEGKYKSAINYYTRYKMYYDTNMSIEQRGKFDELTIKYAGEKKDKNILLLQQEKQLQGAMILQAKYTRNRILAALTLLLIIVVSLIYNARLKQRTNTRLKMQQLEIGKQNNALRNLVNEKDWLVKEIHHRVKNNLQTVMGLLGTQSGYLKNEEALTAMADSQRRIQAMSLIHQRLYQSNNLSSIKMADYIHELVDSLNDSFNTGNRIRFDLKTEAIELDLAHCIPLGLILNEAITNSFKYAFLPGHEGTISISFTTTFENNFLLMIKDNGKGLPQGFDINRSDSMGMNLMRGLSAEIGAKFNIYSDQGTRVDISFVYERDTADEITQTITNRVYPT